MLKLQFTRLWKARCLFTPRCTKIKPVHQASMIKLTSKWPSEYNKQLCEKTEPGISHHEIFNTFGPGRVRPARYGCFHEGADVQRSTPGKFRVNLAK